MPVHAPQSEQDLLRDMQARLAHLEREIRALKTTRRIAAMGRFDHTLIPAPQEGMFGIDPVTETIWYFSNGEWRVCCGA